MARPAGEAEFDALRLDFDRRLKLEFHDSSVTSDAGCQLHADAGVARGGRAMVADQTAGEAGEDRRQSRASRCYAVIHMAELAVP